MTSYVIAPGIGGSDADHWQSIWEASWVGRASRTQPSSWDRPDLSDWVAALDAAYREASARDPRVVIVAHSLGCWAAAAWAGAHPDPAAMLLVAPPDPAAEAFPREEASTFTSVQPRPLQRPAMVVASTDDPYGSIQAMSRFASGWRAELREVGAHGHLNSTSGLGGWPIGRRLLAELERMDATSGASD